MRVASRLNDPIRGLHSVFHTPSIYYCPPDIPLFLPPGVYRWTISPDSTAFPSNSGTLSLLCFPINRRQRVDFDYSARPFDIFRTSTFIPHLLFLYLSSPLIARPPLIILSCSTVSLLSLPPLLSSLSLYKLLAPLQKI